MGAESIDDVLDDQPILRFLPDDVRGLVQRSFVSVTYDFGSTVVEEGAEADAFFVVVSGRARVVKRAENGETLSLNVLGPGDSFGEAALLAAGAKRTATVRASGRLTLLKLDRSVFQAVVQSHPDIRTYLELETKHKSLFNFFRLYTPFAQLPVDALRMMLDELEPTVAAKGELIIRQGDPPGPMYIIEEGRVRVYTEVDGQRRYLAYLRRGDFFGEMSLFRGEARSMHVEAMTEARLMRLTEATFQTLARDYPQFSASIGERIAQYDYQKVARVPLDFASENLPASTPSVVSPEQADVDTAGVGPEEDGAAVETGPFATDDGRFIKRAARIKRFEFVRQIDEMDCGAACLAMVCRHYGRRVSLARIRQVVHTSLDGTSLKGICNGAEGIGLAARSVKASASNVERMPLPAIIHWEGNHWVVVYDVGSDYVRVADPALGLRRLKRAEFENSWSGYAALFDYTEELENAPEGQSSIRWLWPFFRPFKGLLAKAAGLALVVSALEMLLPVFTQVIVDKVVVERDIALLNSLMLVMAGVLIVVTGAVLIQRYLLSFMAVRIDTSTLDFLTRRLLALPMSYFNTRRTGDIQRRLEGIRQVRSFVIGNGVTALTAATQLGASLVLMLLYSPMLTAVFLATAPLYALLMRYSATRLRPMFDELENAQGRYNSYQIDAIRGIETVKAMGAEGALRQLMLNEFHRLARRLFRSSFITMTYEGAVHTVSFMTMVLFLWAGALQVMNGNLSIGGLMAFSSLVALAQGPILLLLDMWDSMQAASVLLDRLNDIFEQEPEQGADHSHLLPVQSLEGAVRLQGMGFRFGGPESVRILDDITLDVPAGKMVAIVGRSGSGKTTLIKCLAGLLEPTDGTIFYDGVDMKKLNYRDLRRRIGFVLQENHLFSDTIARNIALGEDEPEMDRVLWAARVANAHEFVERLPLGYDTKVGESGIAVSGGQRQRISIARAVYHQPPILIFDEATSALDTESERAVKENMSTLLRGRTSFVIAHRLSTIRDADVIIVLEKGRLVEHGTHDELMRREGLYFYLCSQQLGL